MSGRGGMRILVHLEARGVSGNEVQSLTVAAGLRDRGHEVIVSCRAGGEVARRARELGLCVSHVRPRGDVDLLGALRFARLLRRERIEAVLLTSWKRVLTLGWAARRAGTRRVVLRVGAIYPVPRGRKGWKYRRALTHYFDALIANSRAVARHLAGQVPELARRIHRVENGIRAVPLPAAPLRRELGIDGLVLAAVGEITNRKGCGLLIDALARLDDPGVHLVMAGRGPEMERFRARAAEAGLGGRVHFLGYRRDVPAVLAAADAYVSASRSEGMSVALLEAMAAGRPVIASEVGGVWDALAPRNGRGPAGWMVPTGDPAALADAIGEVVADLRAGAEMVRQRVEEAEWRMRHWFSVENMVSGVEDVLRGGAAPEDHDR